MERLIAEAGAAPARIRRPDRLPAGAVLQLQTETFALIAVDTGVLSKWIKSS